MKCIPYVVFVVVVGRERQQRIEGCHSPLSLIIDMNKLFVCLDLLLELGGRRNRLFSRLLTADLRRTGKSPS